MEDLLNKSKNFLKYLENYQGNVQRRSWLELEKKFSEKKFGELRNFYLSQGYLRNIPIEKTNGRYACEIKIEGLKFLNKEKKEKIEQDHQSTTFIITIALVAGAFFQGIVLASYYYLNLSINAGETTANMFGFSILFVLIAIFILFLSLIKTQKK